MLKKAFTLIELLVVIAIIAILAAILFPVFAQAKEAAKKTQCLSNMKQMATALYMYANDYDDMLCQTSWESSNTTQPFNPGGQYQIHWSFLMQPYIKNYDMFKCPSNSDATKPKFPCPSNADLGKLDASGNMYCDWMVNPYTYIPNYNVLPAHDWSTVSISVLDTPANTIAVGERRAHLVVGNATVGAQKGLSGFNPSQPCPGSTQIDPQFALIKSMNYAFWTADLAMQHLASDTSDKADIVRVKWDIHGGNGANYSFADSHAKFQSLAQTLNPNAYEYGPKFYPAFAPYSGTCSN
ncbi:MAG TPA: DUF1559 domain-containing protein [Fimbriimonas sp.]|nr:DUF1559 domain-containing protein [Fimbriimonas sp.]